VISETALPSAWVLHDLYPMCVAEFIGTMMYTATIGIVVSTQSKDSLYSYEMTIEKIQLSLAVGFILISMIYAFGHVSGAHFNPAITLSIWIRKFISSCDALMFIISQILGSIAGVFIAYVVSDEWPIIQHGSDLGRAFAAEFMYTFVLCLVVINVATTESQKGNFFLWCCYWISSCSWNGNCLSYFRCCI